MSDDQSVVFEGYLGARDAKALHGRLCHALADGGPVTIDARAMSDADASILQLLISARKTALQEKRAITFLMQPLGPAEAAFRRAGLITDRADGGSEEQQFWRGLTSQPKESAA